MTEKRTGQTLVNKAGETPGFTLRSGNGTKVVVRNTATNRSRTISPLDVGREYDNALKKLREIGWTEALWAESQEAKRAERLERSAEEEAEILEALTKREADEAPVPSAPGVDKKMHDLLTEALTRTDTLKERLRELHRNNLQGEVVKGEVSMDLLMIQCTVYEGVIDIVEELRRRGMVAKSMR